MPASIRPSKQVGAATLRFMILFVLTYSIVIVANAAVNSYNQLYTQHYERLDKSQEKWRELKDQRKRFIINKDALVAELNQLKLDRAKLLDVPIEPDILTEDTREILESTEVAIADTASEAITATEAAVDQIKKDNKIEYYFYKAARYISTRFNRNSSSDVETSQTFGSGTIGEPVDDSPQEVIDGLEEINEDSQERVRRTANLESDIQDREKQIERKNQDISRTDKLINDIEADISEAKYGSDSLARIEKFGIEGFFVEIRNYYNDTWFFWLFFFFATVFFAHAIKIVRFYLVAPKISRCTPVRFDHKKPNSNTQNHTREINGRLLHHIAIPLGSVGVFKPYFVTGSSSSDSDETFSPYLYEWGSWLVSLAADLKYLIGFEAKTAGQGIKVSLSSPERLGEIIGKVDLDYDQSLILRPSHIVGVIYASHDGRPRFYSRWKLGNLMSWITLKLRYIEIKGKCKIYLWGYGELKIIDASVEKEKAAWGSVVAFQPSLSFGVTRSEAFGTYFREQRPLLVESYEGEGFFIKQSSNLGNRSILSARFWSGMSDLALQALGI